MASWCEIVIGHFSARFSSPQSIVGVISGDGYTVYMERLHRHQNQTGDCLATKTVEGDCYLSTLHVPFSFSKGKTSKTG